MSDKYLKQFYKEITENLDGNYKIILEANRKLNERWIEYDTVKWEIEDSLKGIVEKLVAEENLQFEEKILILYEYICLNYIYDANVLFFFKRDTRDIENIKYIAVDWYGRIIDEKWKENRKKHNRRVCYEFARFYAKAINILREKNTDYEACMVGDVENTHYVVGLFGKKYSILLDLDDFSGIKDLTRLKLGLTIKGIKIIRDDEKIFQNYLDKFNDKRQNEFDEIVNAKNKFIGIEYFENVVEILKKNNIDSQGFFEYMRNIIESEGIEIEKLWREDSKNVERRYERCLLFEYESQMYLLDSVEKNLKIVDKEKIDKDIYIFNPEENLYQYYGG